MNPAEPDTRQHNVAPRLPFCCSRIDREERTTRGAGNRTATSAARNTSDAPGSTRFGCRHGFAPIMNANDPERIWLGDQNTRFVEATAMILHAPVGIVTQTPRLTDDQIGFDQAFFKILFKIGNAISRFYRPRPRING